MSASLRVCLWIVGVAGVLSLAYFVYRHISVPAPIPGAAVTQSDDEIPASGFAVGGIVDTSVVNSAPRQAPVGTKEYRNETYHISLFYPDNLSVKEFDEGKGAATITFQNVATAQGFQMFVVPYTSAQISRARFMQDEPSGVMQSPMNVKIGGVPATSFYGANTFLGETAEIWFLRAGYLYEVTAPKSEAAWFSQIMNTWQFI
jgi:hypothetical protein